ncbi:hypothetical protein BGZ83_000004 [Gryganskiella cystojenkinii]|nr:hypothetical protein BGZ83_000004 [Gryganskiella cystojenkinii]
MSVVLWTRILILVTSFAAGVFVCYTFAQIPEGSYYIYFQGLPRDALNYCKAIFPFIVSVSYLYSVATITSRHQPLNKYIRALLLLVCTGMLLGPNIKWIQLEKERNAAFNLDQGLRQFGPIPIGWSCTRMDAFCGIVWTGVFLPMAVACLIVLEVIMTLWWLRGRPLQSRKSAAKETVANDLAKVQIVRPDGDSNVLLPGQGSSGGGLVLPQQPMLQYQQPIQQYQQPMQQYQQPMQQYQQSMQQYGQQPAMNNYWNDAPTTHTEAMNIAQELKMNPGVMTPHQRGVLALEAGGSVIAPEAVPIMSPSQQEQQQPQLHQSADYVQHLQQRSEAQQQQILELQRQLQQQQQYHQQQQQQQQQHQQQQQLQYV